MNANELSSLLDSATATGRVLLIVIGSGASFGKSPMMSDIHQFLAQKIKVLVGRASDDEPSQENRPTDDGSRRDVAETIASLLDQLAGPTLDTPRSVQNRLYYLLQTTPDHRIRKIWSDFGIALVKGEITSPALPALGVAEPSPLHAWAADLAFDKKAVLVSLNYDGLTRKAVNERAKQATNTSYPAVNTARVISAPEQIRGYFVGEEQNELSATHPPEAESIPSGAPSSSSAAMQGCPIPVIKLRGDVFHATCKNQRCPEFEKGIPLYDLTRKQGSNDDPAAVERLTCPGCGHLLDLEISFPGVFDKEQGIDDSLAAIHQFIGRSIGAVAFVGFSGKWDEALTDYACRAARSMGATIITIDTDEPPAIADSCRRLGVKYEPVLIQGTNSGRDLATIDGLPIGEYLAQSKPSPKSIVRAVCVKCGEPVSIPNAATYTFGERTDVRIGNTRLLRITKGQGVDGFTKIGDQALEGVAALKQLAKCGQLGLKSDFLLEPDRASHNRLNHSAGAAVVAMLWHQALLRDALRLGGWAGAADAQLALELAVLFHDAQHLPFSHMAEEVLDELHWGRVPPIEPREIVDATFGDALKERLSELGVAGGPEAWWENVARLQAGGSGVPWLDAIVDSAVDADKVEYLFHDTRLTGRNVRLASLPEWLGTFLSDQSLSPEGLIRLDKRSASAFLDLLHERRYLYRRLYLAPELRALECVAKHIVITWLKWSVPGEVRLVTEYRHDCGTWTEKGRCAASLLRGVMNRDGVHREIDAVKAMADDLARMDGRIDGAALEFLRALWMTLADFADSTTQGEATLSKASSAFAKLSPRGPLYVQMSDEHAVRNVVRRLRVHYPLLGLVDVVRLPRFLATPDIRTMQIGNRGATAEQFLVPDRRPSLWARGGPPRTPLHDCDFSGLEGYYAQILILDPFGEPHGGAAFLHDMLRRDLGGMGVKLRESPAWPEEAGAT